MIIQNIIDAFNRGHNCLFVNDKSDKSIELYEGDNQRVGWINIYNFLINPKFNTIPTLLADKEFGDSFWEWMFNEGNGHIDYGYPVVLAEFQNESAEVKPTPEMLQGYVTSYITSIIGE